MSWLGAGIGAGIGMILGGPIGAGIGAWLGSSVSNAGSHVRMGSQESQTVFFVTLFSMLAKMAKADGHVDDKEVALIETLTRDQMHMDAEDLKSAMQIFYHAVDDQYSIYDYADQYKQVIKHQQMREMVYRLLFAVAYADQCLHPEEDAILKEIPMHLGLDPATYHIFMGEFKGRSSDLSECYTVLGCSADNSDAEVKRAYRKKCTEYHPDKIAAKGLPEGFMKFAEDEMQKITVAYSTVMEQRK